MERSHSLVSLGLRNALTSMVSARTAWPARISHRPILDRDRSIETARGPPSSHGPRMAHRVNRSVAGKRTGESKLEERRPVHGHRQRIFLNIVSTSTGCLGAKTGSHLPFLSPCIWVVIYPGQAWRAQIHFLSATARVCRLLPGETVRCCSVRLLFSRLPEIGMFRAQVGYKRIAVVREAALRAAPHHEPR